MQKGNEAMEDGNRYDAMVAFELAIAQGRLSADKSAPNYAGHYMYMGPGNGGQDSFKHIHTRAYLPVTLPSIKSPKGRTPRFLSTP